MRITLAGHKGGIAKTTTAVHLAALLNDLAPTLLIDGDDNRSAIAWQDRGPGLPCRVVDVSEAGQYAGKYSHTVIDTAATPTRAELADLARHCDLLILPSSPDILALHGLIATVQTLQEIGATNYRALLTIVPPAPSKDAAEARELLAAANIPVFDTVIRRRAAYPRAALAGTIENALTDYKELLQEIRYDK
jgi:chromosome partitioning protein